MANPAAGQTPFGFVFSRGGDLVVSEAFGGAAGASALSSCDIAGNQLQAISPVVNTNQTAACWVVVTDNGRYGYTTNTGSSSYLYVLNANAHTVVGFQVHSNGNLTPVESIDVPASSVGIAAQ